MMPDRGAAQAGSGWLLRSIVMAATICSALLAPTVASAATVASAVPAVNAVEAADAHPAPLARSAPMVLAVPATSAAIRAADVDTVVAQALGQLGSSSVAVVSGSTADATSLSQVAADARSDGVSLWIVSVGPQAALTQDQTNTVADRILASRHGTVLVLSAEWISVRSDTYTSDQRQAASDAAANAGNSDVAAARAALDSLTAKAFPWGWVIVGVIVAVVLVALAGGWWERRRRRRADSAELARLTTALADRVGALAPSIVSLSDQVDLLGRPDLSDRFSQASTDYNALRDKLASPLPSRRAIRTAEAKVSALEHTIADLTAAVAPSPAAHAADDQRQDGSVASGGGPSTDPS